MPSTQPLFPFILFLPDTKRMLQQIHLLLHMRALQPRRHTSAGVPPRIQDMLPIMMFRLIQQSLDAGLSETPSAGVERLFLAPNDVLGVGVHVEVFLELGPREGVELFDAGDGGVFVFFGGAVLVQGDVGLAGAEDDALDLFGRGDGVVVFRVGDDPLEVGFAGEVFDR